MAFTWVLMGMALFAGSAAAQIVNVSAAANKAVEDGFSSDLGASWARDYGNTDVTDASFHGVGRFKHQDHLLLAIFKRAYGSKDGESYKDSHFEHLRYRLNMDPFYDLELFGQVDHDRFRGYQWRKLYGLGPRFKIFTEPDLEFYLGIAYMREMETYTPAATIAGESQKNVHRASIFLSFLKRLDDRLGFHVTSYYQPSLEDSKDRRLSLETGLKVNLVGSLDLTLSAQVSHDSDPPPGVERMDVSSQTGVSLSI